MEKITLKLHEFYKLDSELNGVVNQQTGEKTQTGLLDEKLSLVTKYWINDLYKKVSSEKASIESLKNDLIKKYGKEDENGMISIPTVIDKLDEEGNPETAEDNGRKVTLKVINPDFQAFEKEFTELLDTERELEYKKISLLDLQKVESTNNYNVFFKLIAAEPA